MRGYLKYLFLASAMFVLVGCDQDIVVKTVCPKINEYSEAQQEQALAEYNALPKNSALRLFIGDYKQLRDKIRVCRGVLPQ